MKNTYLKTKKIVIVLHEGLPVGPSHDLRKFLVGNSVGKLLFIAHPLTYLEEFYKESSRYEYYQNGKLIKSKKAFHWKLPDVLLWCKDFTYSFFWCLIQKEKYDVYFGADPLNALTGLLLRKIGRVRKVVYYSIDYFSNRFSNKMINSMYHAIDKICVGLADETWNLSPVMVRARENYNSMNRKNYDSQKTVPIGLWLNEIKVKSFADIDKTKVIFIGSLVPMMGVDLILRAMPKMLKKIPGLKLEIIGGGKMENDLKKLSYDLRISRHVKFYGWIWEKEKLQKILSNGAIGLAPFNTKILKDEIRNADPAKIKDYMAFGMPVIVTDAISNAKQIEKARCGVIVEYTQESLAEGVASLLLNEKLLKEYRDNALAFVQEFNYEKIFFNNLSRVLKSRTRI